MRTTNFVCGILACIAATSMVDAVAIDQVQQNPVSFAQVESAGNAGGIDCLKGLEATNKKANKISSILESISKELYTTWGKKDNAKLEDTKKEALAIVS